MKYLGIENLEFENPGLKDSWLLSKKAIIN
jgi:hypothetical protein